MSFSIGQRLISSPISAHQTEPVARARANAGAPAWEALKKVMTNRASAADHCKQSLLTTTATSGNQALQSVKSQASSGWQKATDDRVLPPNLSSASPIIGSHRSPELARGKMTVKEIKIDSFPQLASAKMPWHPEKSDVNLVSEKKQMPASFIDSRNFSYTPLPVEHKIEIIEMPKPQRAVFKNTKPAPEIAQGKMSVETVKINKLSHSDPAKMPTQPSKLDAESDSAKIQVPTEELNRSE